MIKYLLDTNACIDLKNGHPFVSERVTTSKPGSLAMSSVTWQELTYGAYKSEQKKHNLARLNAIAELIPVLPYDSNAANQAGQIHQTLRSTGDLIGAYDIQIAGHAVSLKLILITNNTKEFKRVHQLKFEDWRIAPIND